MCAVGTPPSLRQLELAGVPSRHAFLLHSKYRSYSVVGRKVTRSGQLFFRRTQPPHCHYLANVESCARRARVNCEHRCSGVVCQRLSADLADSLVGAARGLATGWAKVESRRRRLARQGLASPWLRAPRQGAELATGSTFEASGSLSPQAPGGRPTPGTPEGIAPAAGHRLPSRR